MNNKSQAPRVIHGVLNWLCMCSESEPRVTTRLPMQCLEMGQISENQHAELWSAVFIVLNEVVRSFVTGSGYSFRKLVCLYQHYQKFTTVVRLLNSFFQEKSVVFFVFVDKEVMPVT